jgi:hypothetical protein
MKIIVKHTQHQILATYIWNICNIKINTLPTYVWKNRWNIESKRLKHTCITIETYVTSRSTFATFAWNTYNTHLKHMLATFVFTLSFFFRTMQSRAGNGRFRPDSGRGWWHSLAVASYAYTWIGPAQRRHPLLAAWPHTAPGMSR